MISLNDLNRNRTKWIEQMEVYKKMLNYLMRIVATIFVIGIIQTTYGQKATEIFIPVGQSPGLSGKYTTLGTVNAVNEEEKTIIMSDSVETYTIKMIFQVQNFK